MEAYQNGPNRDTTAILDVIMNEAEAFMQPSLTYHNFDHVRYSFDFAMRKCDEYEAGGRVKVDRLMVGCAIAFHDAGIAHELPDEFQTKEAYSAHIAGKALETYGFDQALIDGVKDCILATHYDAVPETNEEKLTCMADIANVFGPYPGFLVNSFRNYDELRQINGEPCSLRDFRSSAYKVLTRYMSKDMVIDPIIDNDPGGRPMYAVDGLRNLERFMRASSQQIVRSLGEFATRFSHLIPEAIRHNNEFFRAKAPAGDVSDPEPSKD